MITQLVKIAVPLAYLMFSVALTHAKSSTSTEAHASRLTDVWLEALMDYNGIPAISAAIVQDQEVVWNFCRGLANTDTEAPFTASTSSSIGSVSKVFTATAILKLVDEGKLSLNHSIAEIIDDFEIHQSFPEGGSITISSLLSHSSGLPRDSDHSYWSPPHAFPSKIDLLENLGTLETIHAVGDGVTYGNVNYALLGLIVEKITGQSYKDYMESNLFQPLDMTHTVVEMDPLTDGKNHAIGYTALNRDGIRKKAMFYKTRAMQPAAGISSTIDDLAKFASWQFRLIDSQEAEILKPSTLNSMHELQAQNKHGGPGRGYGYVVYTDSEGSRWALHGGITPGYVAFLKMDLSSKKAYIVIVNANGVRANNLVNGLITLQHRFEELEHIEPTQTNYSEYTGFYDLNPWNSEYYISTWKGGLVMLYLPADSLDHSLHFYKHVSEDTFRLINESGELQNEEITFFRDSKGEINKVKNEGSFHRKLQGA
jgi:CubicO group peptidase (beta-lactamase class C family)